LDAFLCELYTFRKEHELSKPNFSRNQLSEYAGYDETLRNVVDQIIQRHGQEIYFLQPHPLLDELGVVLERDSVVRKTYHVYRLATDTACLALEKIIVLATQTVVQLPKKPNKVGSSTEALQRLARSFESLAERTESIVSQPETRERILFFCNNDPETTPATFFPKADDLRNVAKALSKVTSTTRVSRLRYDSPSPQVQWATYVVVWMKLFTGTPNYTVVKILLEAAFSVAGQETPKWVDRLPVEMQLRRQRRKEYAKSITVPAVR
jgi:hypothetical protein